MSSPTPAPGNPGFLYTCRLAPDGTYTFTAPEEGIEALYEITPADMGRMLTTHDMPFLPGAGPELWESIRLSAENLTPWVGDTHIRAARTGRERWVRVHGVPRREPDGAVVWAGLITDITDLKTAEARLRETADALARSEARMRAALGGARMFGWDLDLAAGRLETTGDFAEFFGLAPGPDFSDPAVALTAVHSDDVPAVLEGRRRAIETGQPMRYEFRGRVPAADGFPRWYTTRGQILKDAAGKPVRIVAVTTDVTERKRAEAERAVLDGQLLDAQKWESLGVLAGGVAHDFNNILTIVLGNAGLARQKLPPSHTVGPLLEQIEQAARRAGDLCRQLLAYSGRGQVATGTADLNQLIRASTALLEVPASKAATVRFELADGLPIVRGDPSQVRQVVVNLVMNAAEAVGDAEGEVRVATGVAEVPAATPTGYHLPPATGRYVRLAVSDTGPGIPPDVRTRMFDPFFTTKFAGRGLGLAAVLGIIRANRGAIRVDTAPGRGTTVEILWPVADPPSRPAEGPPPVGPSGRRPTGKALVVDDEMFVREVTASTLEELGYEALLAGDGRSALELFRENRDAVRVAVIDVVMPGMTGDQLLTALRAVEPALPAVLVSGFSERASFRAGIGTRTEFLQKPFHPEELSAAVARVLTATV